MNRLRRGRWAALVACVAATTVVVPDGPPAAAAPNDGLFGSTTLELVSDDAAALDAAGGLVAAHGGTVLGEAPGVVLAELPPFAWPALGAIDGVELRRPVPVDVRPERVERPRFGPTAGVAVDLTGAAAWHAAGIDGSGVRIGVIDFFDTTYWDVAEHGPLPVAGVTARCFREGADCTDEFFDGVDLGGEQHGVAVVEILRDMAPGAEIYLGQAGTLADYRLLIDWFVQQGVRIVSRSLGSRYDGPGDGRGALDEIAADAVSRGITWINSGGNSGDGRYYRQPVRLVGDRVAFGPSGSETFLPLRGCIALGGMRWSHDWDLPPSERTDYDLYVWDAPTGSPAAGAVVASSRRRQTSGASPLETVLGQYCPASGRTLYLEARWLGGAVAGDVLEILDYGDGFAKYTQTASSAAVPVVDSSSPGVVAVGAVDPPGSGVIAPYSSQGPTSDGRLAPDVSAPSGFWSSVYGGSFSGTSAAAPVVAGVAALFVDAGVAGSATGLGDLLRNSTVDHGPIGPDNAHGHGEIRLPAPPPGPVDSRPARYVPLRAPTRFLDTRPTSPVGPPASNGTTWPGEIRRLAVAGVGDVPAGATAVAVNVTAVRPGARSYVQVAPLWQSAIGAYSNLNVDGPGQVRANFAIVPVGDDGTIALYTTAAGHLVVDVLGWFEPTGGAVRAGRFVDLGAPRRLLDTRDAGTPLRSGDTLRVPRPSDLPWDEIEALVLTVTVVEPTGTGWLQAFPADRPDVIGTTSTVNAGAGENVAGTVIVPVGSLGVGVHAYFAGGGAGHVLVDMTGYMTSGAAPLDTAGRYVPLTPRRAYDSRTAGGPLDTGSQITVAAGLPTSGSAVVWNLTVVEAAGRGHAVAWAADRPVPGTSALNWSRRGEVRAAAALTGVSAGASTFRIADGRPPGSGPLGDLLADVFGYFT